MRKAVKWLLDKTAGTLVSQVVNKLLSVKGGVVLGALAFIAKMASNHWEHATWINRLFICALVAVCLQVVFAITKAVRESFHKTAIEPLSSGASPQSPQYGDLVTKISSPLSAFLKSDLERHDAFSTRSWGRAERDLCEIPFELIEEGKYQPSRLTIRIVAPASVEAIQRSKAIDLEWSKDSKPLRFPIRVLTAGNHRIEFNFFFLGGSVALFLRKQRC
jgi:hypothetical protein